jgi:hypothetical protein
MPTMQPDYTHPDDWLEQALRADGDAHRSAYIADDGFAASVMARLPVAATPPAWRRPVLALIWLGAGIAALLAAPGLFEDAFRSTVALFVGQRIGVADLAALLGVLAAATWATLIYAARAD